MKKKLPKKPSTQTLATKDTYPKDQVLAMFESLTNDIQIIAEGQGSLTQKVDGLAERVDAMDEKIEHLSGKVYSLDEKVESLDKKVESLDKKVESLDKKVEDMQGDINEIKYDLKHKTDYDNFEKLEKRMIKVERVVFSKKFA